MACAFCQVLIPNEDVHVCQCPRMKIYVHMHAFLQSSRFVHSVLCEGFRVNVCECVCICASPLSCQCNWRLLNRISAAWQRFMPTLELLIRLPAHRQPCMTDCFLYRREGEREREERHWSCAEGESERPAAARREVDKRWSKAIESKEDGRRGRMETEWWTERKSLWLVWKIGGKWFTNISVKLKGGFWEVIIFIT